MDGSKSSSKAVVEFVKELEGLKADSLVRQGPGLANDEKLIASLMEFLLSEQCSEEQLLLERFYGQMLRCYRTFDEHLMRFVSQFMFCFIWRHFSDLIKSRQYGIAIRPGLDALLVAIYNMAIVDSEGHPRVQAYTIPSLGNASIYHDPSEFTVHILRDSARLRGESEEKRLVIGNYPSVDTLTRAKKWIVFRVLMRSISQDLPYHTRACQKSAIIVCRLLIPSSLSNVARPDVELAAKREIKAGLNFERLNNLNFKSFSMGKDKARTTQIHPKIVLDERFLVDILDILYILAFQGLYDESLGLVLDLLEEGEYRILPSVVLLGSAIKSRLEASKTEQDELSEIPPINSGGTGEESARKPGMSFTNGGSVREKRRRSFITKKNSNLSRAGESFHETVTNEVDEPSRADTPINSTNNNDAILETGELPSNSNTPVNSTPMWSPDISPQQFIKVSPRTNSNGVAETIV